MVRVAKTVTCHMCSKEVKPEGAESYKLITEIELKDSSVIEMEFYIKPKKINLCLNCAVGVARQGICKLCE